MKLLRSYLPFILFLSLPLIFIGCTKSTSDSDDSSQSENGPAESSTQILSDCGIIADGAVRNPLDSNFGEQVQVTTIVNHHLVIVRREQGDQLVKLRGLKEDLPQFKVNAALSELSRLRGSAYLFTDGCPYLSPGGGQGVVGDLVSVSTRKSYVESLLSAGAAEPTAEGGCGESELFGCYQSLSESATPITGATVRNFLWKPVAERDGNLVILLSPARASVFVNGQALVDFGPSNARGTTARANRPGCAFGANARVEAFDSQGRPLVFPGGATSFTIPNGCSRVEFQ